MKKALLKKIPVVEAGIKDKQYMELCRQNYLMKVQKATVAHKRTLILNLYNAENIIKEQYQPFCRIFFSNRDFITYFIKENRWSIKTLDILESEKGKFISQIAIRTYKEKRSIQQFFHCTDDFAYCKIFESNRDFLELNQYASIRKIVSYLAKQIEKEKKGKAYKLSGDVSGISHVEMKCYQTYIRSWKDYIEWAEKLEYDLKSRYVLFPKNFKDVHDKTFLEYQKQQDKMERRKQAKERRTVNQLLKKDIKLLDTKIQDKDYLLKVPENCQEIRKEGQALGHCVGSYIPHIANRECDVYFIRKKTDPDKPFFTVDWRRGKIVQCQGKGRIRYPQEMVEFVHYAEEKLRLLKGEEEKKAA